MGHLFSYQDSLLVFNSERIANYSLESHVDPNVFREVTDPTTVGEWVHSESGDGGKEQPGRRKERLKAHSRW